MVRVLSGVPVPELDPGEVERRADEILSRPELQPEPEGLVERALDAVGELIGDLLGSLFSGGGSAVLAWAILGLVIAVVAVLVVRLTRSVRADAIRTGVAAVEARRSPVEWLVEAERHEASGDWRQALRCRYRALVAELAGRRLLRDQPGRTAGEHRADLAAAAPDRAPAFAGATELFEQAWYGHRPTGPDESARFQELAAEVLVEMRS